MRLDMIKSKTGMKNTIPSNLKRITANLPDGLLAKAQSISDKGITETLVAGLELICRTEALTMAKKLKGKIQLQADGGRRHGRSTPR